MYVCIPSSDQLSDSDLLKAAQSGETEALTWLPYRFGGLGGGDQPPDGPVAAAARAACRRTGHLDAESVEEVVSRIYAYLLDPEIARFNPVRGTVPAYLRGLADNGAKALVARDHAPLPVSAQGAPSGLSIEDRDCVCWAFRTAPKPVRRAFSRLRGGRTLDEAARSAGVSRRSLTRAIDAHLARCRRIMLDFA